MPSEVSHIVRYRLCAETMLRRTVRTVSVIVRSAFPDMTGAQPPPPAIRDFQRLAVGPAAGGRARRQFLTLRIVNLGEKPNDEV